MQCSGPNIKFIRTSPNAHLINKGTLKSAGYDLSCYEDVVIPPRAKQLVNTGWKLNMPDNYVGLIKERSGLALKTDISVKAGVIDPDYTGEIKVLLKNLGDEEIKIEKGIAVAQIIFVESAQNNVFYSEDDGKNCLEIACKKMKRNDSGFGSTD